MCVRLCVTLLSLRHKRTEVPHLRTLYDHALAFQVALPHRLHVEQKLPLFCHLSGEIYSLLIYERSINLHTEKLCNVICTSNALV